MNLYRCSVCGNEVYSPAASDTIDAQCTKCNKWTTEGPKKLMTSAFNRVGRDGKLVVAPTGVKATASSTTTAAKSTAAATTAAAKP